MVNGLSSGVDKGGKWSKRYRTVFSCDSCDAKVESDDEYFSYQGYLPKRRGRPRNPCKIDPEWTITEEVGLVVVNDYALANVTDYAVASAKTLLSSEVTNKK